VSDRDEPGQVCSLTPARDQPRGTAAQPGIFASHGEPSRGL